jgi:hypothetical protein
MLRSIRKPAFSHSESASALRRIEDTVSARLWIADGFPIADVLTLLEFRHRFEFSPDAARAYAIETLLALKAETIVTHQYSSAHRKEPRNALA